MSRSLRLITALCLSLAFAAPAAARRGASPRATSRVEPSARVLAKRIFSKNGQIASFERITGGARAHLKGSLKFSRKNRNKDLTWRGPSLPRSMAAVALPFDQHFKASNLRYSEREQGRDALTEILGTLVQLGMEQGRLLVASGTRLQKAERGVKRAKRLVAKNQLADASTALAGAAKALPSKTKHVRTARKRYNSLKRKNAAGKRDWPAASEKPLPVRPKQLVAAAADVVLQAYNVRTKSGKMATKAHVERALMVGLEAGIEQGKRYSFDEHNVRGLGRTKRDLQMASMFFRPDVATSPALSSIARRQLDSALESISSFKTGR